MDKWILIISALIRVKIQADVFLGRGHIFCHPWERSVRWERAVRRDDRVEPPAEPICKPWSAGRRLPRR